MTKNELNAMTGREELTDLAIELLLKQVKPDFIRSAVRAEAAEIEAELKELETQGWAVNRNNVWRANWSKAEELNGWNLTVEQEAAYDAAWTKCSDVEALSFRQRRVNALLANI